MVQQVKEASSFRDTSGQVVVKDGVYLRQVSPSYYSDYNHLMSSGLYGKLITEGLLIPHTERHEGDVLTLVPEQVKFISYPYECCFGMLKEAALNTLEINCIALDYGMMLKDASAFNMQWHKGKMTLIDTLSLAKYEDGQPWVAYRQFIEHFLTPLLLMKYRNASLSKLSAAFIDGIPILLATQLLPIRTRIIPSILAHLYMQSLNLDGKKLPKEIRMPKRNLDALLDSLMGLVKGLTYKSKSDWIAYNECSYSTKADLCKYDIVKGFLRDIPKGYVCDIGANIGAFSELAMEVLNDGVFALDRDHDCIEIQYHRNMHWLMLGCSERPNILPLVVDLCNPTPAIGWGNTERKSFLDRLDVDTIMALALIHHICIGNNTPLSKVAELFAGHCKHLIIEFIPPDDPKVKILAGNKTYPPYSQSIFEAEFSKYFRIKEKKGIEDSCRSIYLMSV